MITPREVKLVGGKRHGTFSFASHDTVQTEDGPYVYDGGDDPDQFEHVDRIIKKLPPKQRKEEQRRVKEWLDHEGVPTGHKGPDGKETRIPAPMGMLIGIPPWRINAWVQKLRPNSLSTSVTHM